MMEHEVTQKAGARRRRRRIGRGEASGWGKTSGRGHKGYKQRSGGGPHSLHEGGQMPIFRRMPKRGFSNFQFATPVHTVNLRDLNRAFDDGATVDLNALREARLVRGSGVVKLLATGTIEKKLTVEAHACSAKARELIEKAGGSIKLVERVDSAAAAKAKRFSAKKGEKRERVTRLAKKKSAGQQS